MSNTKTNQLTELCDKTIERLEHAVRLLKGIKAQDAASPNSVAWLRGLTRTIPYEGDVLCVNVDPIFAELEQMEADEVFGPREGEDEETVELTAEPIREPNEETIERLLREGLES